MSLLLLIYLAFCFLFAKARKEIIELVLALFWFAMILSGLLSFIFALF